MKLEVKCKNIPRASVEIKKLFYFLPCQENGLLDRQQEMKLVYLQYHHFEREGKM